MRSIKSTIASVTLFAAVACFAVALLAPVSAAPEPSLARTAERPLVDGHKFAPDTLAARVATGDALRRDLPRASGSFADADRPLRQVVAIEVVATAIRAPRPGPGALLMAGLIGVGAIAWRRAASRPNQRLDASIVLR